MSTVMVPTHSYGSLGKWVDIDKVLRTVLTAIVSIQQILGCHEKTTEREKGK